MSTEYIAPVIKSQQDLVKYLPELAVLRGLAESRRALLGALFLIPEFSGRRRSISDKELEEKTDYDEKTMQRCRRQLEGLGVISVYQRKGWLPLVYRLHDMFYTEEGIAFLQECAALIKRPVEKVVEGVSTLYSYAKCYYYKLKDYLGSSRFNYLELMFNFKSNKREKLTPWLDKFSRCLKEPLTFLTRKEERIMEEIGYVEKDTPVEYPISETVYSPKSQQPIGFNTAQMWEKVHKQDKREDEANGIQRLAEIEHELRTSDDGRQKQDLEVKVHEINSRMFSIMNQILFGLPRQKEAAKAEQAARQEELKELAEKIKLVEARQVELLKEKEVWEAKLARYKRVKDYSVPVV